jgi:hypothetical protein
LWAGGHPHRATGGLCVELLSQIVQFTLQRDHLLAKMHHCRGPGQVDAKVLDESTNPLHVLDISFRIQATATGPNWLEQSPLFVSP